MDERMNHLPKQSLFERLERNPALFFLTGYLLVIVVGTFLLMLPISTADGTMPSPVDALFVITSAVCVTGLSPVVTATYWSGFGHLIILLWIQLGGLGIMTAVAIFGMLTGQRIGLVDRRILMEEKNESNLTGMIRLIQFIISATFLLEGIGAVLLAIRFVPLYGLGTGIWYAIWHAVSAFCNAGFDILGPDSLVAWRADPLVMFTISALIVIAGIGFTVYLDLLRWKEKKRLRLHSKLALLMTGLLLLVGMVLILLGEAGNPDTLGALSWPGKLLNAFFQSVTTRTAGFFSFAQEKMTQFSTSVSVILMFIGGSPAGTAGGLKTTTFLVLMLGLAEEFRQRGSASIFRRSLSHDLIHNAAIMLILSLLWVSAVVLILSYTETGKPLADLAFEAVSAFGTVGLTRSVTGDLSSVGKMLIAMTMLFGKLGPLTMLHALIPRGNRRKNRYGSEPVMIG